MLRRIPYLAVLCGLVLGSATTEALAQRRSGAVGLGGQIGDPSGVTLKLYQNPGFAYDLIAAWDLDDFFFVNGHGVYERNLQDSPLGFFYGPGVFLGFADGRGKDDDTVVGVSGNFGLNLFIEQFEVFLQVTPRLSLLPETDGDIGAGIGLRYFFE